jgi:hypothetical protein
MNPIFNLELYKKLNPDLIQLSDEELTTHFNEIGQYQLRIYYPISLFKKEKVYIFSTKFGYYISNVLRYLLFKNFIFSEIIYKIDPINENLHIIPFCQKVNQFPKNYIIYQLEQKDISKWINKKYELVILHSSKTLDYSQSNINKFPEIIRKKMIYYPIPIIPYHYLNYKANINIIPQNNILFYGSMNEIRREKLNYLQRKLYPKYFIKIVTNKYGTDLFNEILNSKIVLNIHFYKDAILETYRINEVLSCGRIVISEKPNMIDIENYHLYKDKITFIDNINDMASNIVNILENDLFKKNSAVSLFDIDKFNEIIL